MSAPNAPAAPNGGHRKLSVGLVIAGTVVALLAIFSIWANRQLLNTDNWVSTSDRLISNEKVDERLANYLLALQTKRFVLLCGISGTGKTRLACEVARQFNRAGGRTEVVAVRPDWTDNRGLLGYPNPILGSYVTTPTLRLLLDAAAEVQAAERDGGPPRPFFLILDEMNLARVEHELGRFEFDLYGKVGYVYAAVVLFLAWLVCRRLLLAPFGRSLVGIRENPVRMAAIGVPVARRKLVIFTVAAALAGLAGALSAQTNQFVSLNSLSFELSGTVLVVLVLRRGHEGLLQFAPL